MEKLKKEKEYLYWLCTIETLGAVALRKIWEQIGSFEQAYYIEGTQLLSQGIFRTRTQAEAFEKAKGELEKAVEELGGLRDREIRFITVLDQEYPARLRHIYDYPMGLWVKGSLPRDDRPSAAVIGSRTCSSYGEQMAAYMARELAKAGVQILGGLALGIDRAGHLGALEGGGKTWGVLGCGINICYPRTNYPVFARMEHQGGLLTEYRPGTPARASHFPVRNRIISGLSDAILIMEARERSGSLITAQLGLDQGKEIFALPGRVTDAASRGCNQLIKAGAQVLTGPEEVLEYLGLVCEKTVILCEKNQKGLAKNEKMVYSCLDSEPRHVEEIAGRCQMDAAACILVLTQLELKGFALKTTGQYYVRRLEGM